MGKRLGMAEEMKKQRKMARQMRREQRQLKREEHERLRREMSEMAEADGWQDAIGQLIEAVDLNLESLQFRMSKLMLTPVSYIFHTLVHGFIVAAHQFFAPPGCASSKQRIRRCKGCNGWHRDRCGRRTSTAKSSTVALPGAAGQRA